MTHPLAVARTVHDWGLDEASIAAALLHDVVEDTHVTKKDVEKKFGAEIAFLVESLTKIQEVKYAQKDPDVENIRKLILSFSKDLRVILIKLADRLHNMKTLEFMSEEKRKEISWETLEIYAPLAYRLGMQKVSGDLEDLAFPFLYPQEYRWLRESLGERYEERVLYAEKIKPVIKREMLKGGIAPYAVDSRAKHYYSLWRKLMRYDMDIEKIYDLVALRIIVNSVEDCYAALGIIHKNWQPLPGRFKDYIAHPKSNGYRSLHTTVFCVDRKITEIQIRTREMHEENEIGVAAHWAYSEAKSAGGAKKWEGVENRKELLWVEQLRDWQKNFGNQENFLESLKVDFFKDRVFALTPENDIIDLPAGATPVDFAYQIHREIGEHCIGAKINGKIVPLETAIQSGDVVEILTQQNKKPSEDWLRFVKTSMAKKYIRSSVRKRLVGSLAKKAPHYTDFRIIARDDVGYLKELTALFGEMKVNIASLASQSDKRHAFALVHVRCHALTEAKAKKLVTRIGAIPATKEASWKTTAGA
jgi:GTP pyrophosphokinase